LQNGQEAYLSFITFGHTVLFGMDNGIWVSSLPFGKPGDIGDVGSMVMASGQDNSIKVLCTMAKKEKE
jgi:hypothetical protein